MLEVPPLCRRTSLESMLGSMHRCGVPVGTALQRARLPTELDGPSQSWIPYLGMRHFIADVARREGLWDLGWRASLTGATQSITAGIRARILMAPTLLGALREASVLARYQSTHLRIWLERSDRGMRVCHNNLVGPEVPGYGITEAHTHGAFISIVRAFADPQWLPEVISILAGNSAVEDSLSNDHGLEVEVRSHERCAGFEIPVDLLRTPGHGHTRIHEPPDAIAAPATIKGAVHGLVSCYLSSGPLPLHTAAELLGCTTRTLQRSLAAENTSYSAVVTRARLDAARQALADPEAPITDVALKLGYSEHSAFTRAFKRWVGMAPEHYQKRQLSLQN